MSPELAAAVQAALADALGTGIELRSASPLGGGDTNHAARLDTSEGPFFLKHHPAADGRFPAEARQLGALHRSGTSLRIAEPLGYRDGGAHGEGFLVCRFIEPGRRGPGFDERLGAGLAELHRASADQFGFDIDTPCGATVQPNRWSDRWVAFFRDQRLGFAFRQLRERGQIGRDDARACDRLLDHLPELITEPQRASLIHGDLWSGNLMVADDGPALVDPAAYYAHREAELGMMVLFGGFGPRVYEAYREAWPLEPGWEARVRCYRLWHVANHALLFGGGYIDDTVREARSLVGRI